VDLPLEDLAAAAPAPPAPEAFLEPGDDVWVLRVVPEADAVQTIRIPRPDTPRHAAMPKPQPNPAAPLRAPKPIQDEWGFFDPSQCGFSALIAKLDEIAEHEDLHEPPAETCVRVLSY
jgi:hypothetical protein